MKITIVGVGNIGTAYGWAFTQAGHEVTHLVRGPSQRPEQARLDVLDERSGKAVQTTTDYRWTLSASAPSETELVLVATPAAQVRDAVAQVVAQAPEATFLTWALEWNGVELTDLVGPDRLLVGYPDSGGTRDPAGNYVLSLGKEPHLGVRAGAPARERLASVQAAFGTAGFAPVVEDPFEAWLWVHCANTIPYWLALAQHQDLGTLMADRPLLRRAFRASREIVAVAKTRGQDLSGSDELATMKVPAPVFPFIFRLLYRTNEGMRRAAAHGVEGIGEGLDLADEVQATARAAGVSTPQLDSLAARARQPTAPRS